MKILLPTDFSKLSKVAVQFASKLSKKLNAELILIHVVYIDAPPRAQVALKTSQIIDTMIHNATEDCNRIIKEIKQEVGNKSKISFKIEEGYPVEDVIVTFAQNNNIDLIIMGTKGATGLKKILIGSNATAVISNCDIPVITVPEHARFRDIKHIVYASDMLALNKEVKTLIKFAQLFNSTIHVLHIINPTSRKKIDIAKIKRDLIAKHNYKKISIYVSLHEDIKEAIDEYISDIKADVLAMFTHKPTFFEKLFGKSVTRELAFHSWIPLLSIKR